MKIQGRTILSYLAFGLLAGVVGLVGLVGILSVRADLVDNSTNMVPQVNDLKDFDTLNWQVQETFLEAYQFGPTGDARHFQALLDEQTQNLAEMVRLLDRVEGLDKNQEQAGLLKTLRAMHAAWLALCDPNLEVLKDLAKGLSLPEATQALARLAVVFGPLREASDLQGLAVDKAAESFLNDMTTVLDNALATSNLTFGILGVLFLISLVGALSVGFLLARSLANPLKTTARLSLAIAQGLTGERVPEAILTKTDEVGDLGRAFELMIEERTTKEAYVALLAQGILNKPAPQASDADSLGRSLAGLTESLNEVLSEVTGAVDQVATGASQISSAAQDLSQGATTSAATLEQITASLSEVTGTARKNSEAAIQVAQFSAEATANLEDGNRKMSELVASFAQLNDRAQGITRTVKTIDDIAFQINLLALNANVEAARAGQFGRGFGVVAEEVRNLANRSGQSVKETAGIVEGILHNLDACAGLVQSLAKQLETMVVGSQRVSAISHEVRQSSQNQSTALEQSKAALDQIDAVTQANTASAEECAAAAEELESQSAKLAHLMTRFSLRNEP